MVGKDKHSPLWTGTVIRTIEDWNWLPPAALDLLAVDKAGSLTTFKSQPLFTVFMSILPHTGRVAPLNYSDVRYNHVDTITVFDIFSMTMRTFSYAMITK